MALDLKKFVERFIEEAREHLAKLGEGLTALEKNPADKETIAVIFRSAHTIKGSSKMLKLTGINETAHKLEDVLDAMRSGSLVFRPALGRILFRAVDALADLVERLARGEVLPAADAGLVALLEQSLSEEAGPDIAEPEPAAPSLETKVRSADTVRIRLTKLDELVKLMNEVISSHTRTQQRLQDLRAVEKLRFAPALDDGERLQRIQQELHAVNQQMRDDVATQDLLIHDLHAKALILRMLPLAMVFDPMGRMVREIAHSLGKEVECVISGSELELDRQMIDALGDPILHLLRNSVDHGIEVPEVRKSRGKLPRGRISLRAYQDGAWVVVEVADDGAGIPVDAVREKALRKGFLTPERAESMEDQQILELIFLPGFSTSPIITDLSGRGVGLDVVKNSIVEGLHGLVHVESNLGIGTVFSLRLPLSLAVMRILMVRCGGLPFGFTAPFVVEILRSDEKEFRAVAGRRVVILRNEFVPVHDLCDLLNLPEGTKAKPTPGDPGTLLLVVGVRDQKMALVIDALIDERDMVIKPLPEHLRRNGLVSGMVTTGKNELVNILHVPVLLERAGSVREDARNPSASPAVSQRKSVHILVVDDSLNTREIEKDVLEAHGYQVTLAEDGLDGLRKARLQTYDAVLTDVEMPNMDGFTLTERLREEPEYRDTPIIILSSRQKEDDKRRGIRVGADAYMVKGDFDQGNLLEILRNFGL